MIKEKALVTLKNDIEVEYPFSDDLPMKSLICRSMEYLSEGLEKAILDII